MNERNGLCKPFLYLAETPRNPCSCLISRKNHIPVAPLSARVRNTYWALAFLTFATGSLFVAASADAFWPFSIGRAAETATPVLHDESLPLLQAALNPDPSPVDEAQILTSGGSALLPTGGFDGAAAVYRENAQSGGKISVYEVREGDTLSGIASMFDVSVNTIVWANDLKSKTINPGMRLLILPVDGLKYTVKNGGTIRDVAKKFDTDADEIAAYNGLAIDAPLTKGQQLIIPGATIAAPKASPSSSSHAHITAPTRIAPTVSGYFANPVPDSRVTQGIHGYNGIDFGSACGTPVYASAPGIVYVAKAGGTWNGGYGNYVVIAHPNGTQTLYAHLSSVAATMGASVDQGELVGAIGNTGRSTGCHLHFEVRGAANPFAY